MHVKKMQDHFFTVSCGSFKKSIKRRRAKKIFFWLDRVWLIILQEKSGFRCLSDVVRIEDRAPMKGETKHVSGFPKRKKNKIKASTQFLAHRSVNSFPLVLCNLYRKKSDIDTPFTCNFIFISQKGGPDLIRPSSFRQTN